MSGDGKTTLALVVADRFVKLVIDDIKEATGYELAAYQSKLDEALEVIQSIRAEHESYGHPDVIFDNITDILAEFDG